MHVYYVLHLQTTVYMYIHASTRTSFLGNVEMFHLVMNGTVIVPELTETLPHSAVSNSCSQFVSTALRESQFSLVVV